MPIQNAYHRESYNLDIWFLDISDQLEGSHAPFVKRKCLVYISTPVIQTEDVLFKSTNSENVQRCRLSPYSLDLNLGNSPNTQSYQRRRRRIIVIFELKTLPVSHQNSTMVLIQIM
jgi:hypothetical protein